MLLLSAVLTCGLCGCAADEPLVATSATKAKASTSNPDGNADVTRDIANKQLSAASQGSIIPRNLNSGALQQGNPYSH